MLCKFTGGYQYMYVEWLIKPILWHYIRSQENLENTAVVLIAPRAHERQAVLAAL